MLLYSIIGVLGVVAVSSTALAIHYCKRTNHWHSWFKHEYECKNKLLEVVNKHGIDISNLNIY